MDAGKVFALSIISMDTPFPFGVGCTYWLRQAVKSVDNGASFQQGFGLDETQTTASARNADDLVCEYELGHAVLGAQVDGRSVGGLSRTASGLLGGGDSLDVDRHCYENEGNRKKEIETR